MIELPIDPETGEILEGLPEGLDETGAVAYLAALRDDARRQEEAWRAQRARYDAALLRWLEPGTTAVYGDLRVAVRSRRGAPVTDAARMAVELHEAEASRDVLLRAIAAARGFDRAALVAESPDGLVALAVYDACTAPGPPSRPWIETGPVLRRR